MKNYYYYKIFLFVYYYMLKKIFNLKLITTIYFYYLIKIKIFNRNCDFFYTFRLLNFNQLLSTLLYIFIHLFEY